MIDRELVARIARSAGRKAGYKQLVRELGLGGGRERRLLLEQLARLTVRGELTKLDRDTWSIPRPVAVSRRIWWRGAWTCIAMDTVLCGPTRGRLPELSKTFSVPPPEINGAMQGDQVLVEVEPPKADGRRMGRIARVLERRNPTVVGVFHAARSDREQGDHVVPFDERMTQHILIPPGQSCPPRTLYRHRIVYSALKQSLVQNLKARRAWKAWWSMWRSRAGRRQRGPQSVA